MDQENIEHSRKPGTAGADAASSNLEDEFKAMLKTVEVKDQAVKVV